jgi:hypothetical protein
MSRRNEPMLIQVFNHQIIIIFSASLKFNVFPKSDWSLSQGSDLIFLGVSHKVHGGHGVLVFCHSEGSQKKLELRVLRELCVKRLFFTPKIKNCEQQNQSRTAADKPRFFVPISKIRRGNIADNDRRTPIIWDRILRGAILKIIQFRFLQGNIL